MQFLVFFVMVILEAFGYEVHENWCLHLVFYWIFMHLHVHHSLDNWLLLFAGFD